MSVHQCKSLGAPVYHRQGIVGSVAVPEKVRNINCGAASMHSLISQGTLTAVAVHNRNRFSAPVL
jgi:hypothetical protein